MKTLIVGNGVIGTIYGWALTEAGIEVSHLTRTGRAASLQPSVELDLLDERKGHRRHRQIHYTLLTVEQVTPADGYELVIVPTHVYQTAEALQMLAPCCPQAIFLVLAANWVGADFIEHLLPQCYVMGYADGGGTQHDGVYWTKLGDTVHLGITCQAAQPALERVTALFAQADINVDVRPHILHWLWVHNASSTAFWAGFAKYRAVKPFLHDRALLKQCYDATRETLALCERRGVDLSRYPDLRPFRMPFWLFAVLFRHRWTANMTMEHFITHAADTIAETKANYNAIMQTAQLFKVDMPAMRELGVYIAAA